MAETRAQRQKRIEEALRQLKENDEQLVNSINQLKENDDQMTTSITQLKDMVMILSSKIDPVGPKGTPAPMKLNQVGWSSASSSPAKPYSNPVVRTDSKLANPNPPELKAPANSFTSSTSNSPTYMPFKTLTPKEMDAKRAKGLCFNCDERFVKGHRCQKKQLYVIIGDEEEEEDIGQDNPGVDVATLKDEMLISIHALAESNSFRTMRVVGTIKGKEVVILIDSGTTHNFIDLRVAKISGIMVEQTPDLTVTIADGT
ncbi:hypothetical protein RHSIM_Rhsim01G0093400 [Rhododendron simsii]|uniref:Uncharacterized protein n=1 Tax=Rhododendron simsii TaxID=118357 RepID=A0A834HHV0_RHOSS|nr:hypothetical protein RHSIM_Rhsim01G0093400 [Rhododendron simsii]